MSSRKKRGRAHHQPAAVVLDFVNPVFFAAFFLSALRFLVAVSSDLSGCSCVLKALFSKLSRRPRYSRSLIRTFFFIAHPASKSLLRNTLRDDHPRREKRPHGPVGAGKTEPCRSSHYAHGLEDRCAGNQAALVIKISVRFNLQRKVHSWDGARRCTICDSVTVRSARRRNAKNE